MTSCVVESLFDWMYAMQMVDFLWIRITQVCQPFLKFSKQTNASVNFQWIGSNAKTIVKTSRNIPPQINCLKVCNNKHLITTHIIAKYVKQ